MAEKDAEVKLYLDHVRVTVKDATEAVLEALAFRILERAQLNIRQNNQIDTGFMVNSGYVKSRKQSTYDDTDPSGEYFDQMGAIVERELAPEESLPGDAAAGVIFGANYAIYQEGFNPFLYPGADAAAREFGGEAERIYKERMPDEGPRD